MSVQSFPTHATDLVKDLDKRYPERCIDKGESFEDHLRYAGARDVIRWLNDWLSAANRLASKE